MTTRYEQLRKQVLGESDGNGAIGFVTLLRHGMVAWIEICATAESQPSAVSRSENVEADETAQPEIVSLLAGMVLHRYQEVNE